MIKIALQAGHENAAKNCDAKLRSGTGAPGEVDFTIRVRNRLSEGLIKRGFQVYLFDATANCNPQIGKEDFDLFLAIHYDANIYGEGGGFIDFPEPSTDMATARSQEICRVLESQYFEHSGIVNKPNRRNKNTKFYYMWKFLSAKTPCNIIECGVGLDAHDSVILSDTDRVCNAIIRGLCKAFNVPFDVTPPPPAPPAQPTLEGMVIEICKPLGITPDFGNRQATINLAVEKINQLKQAMVVTPIEPVPTEPAVTISPKEQAELKQKISSFRQSVGDFLKKLKQLTK